MVRSCLSLFAAAGGVVAAVAADVTLGAGGALLPPIGGTGCPGFAGALAAGLFGCCEAGGAFGAKNFAQAIITTIDNNEATKMRNSGRRPLLFCGSLTNVSRPSSPAHPC